MRKFPDIIATKQDVENILNNHPEYHVQLKTVLQRALDEPKTAIQVLSSDIDPETNEMTNIVTKEIPTPNPIWKRMGFKDLAELDSIINNQLQAKVL